MRLDENGKCCGRKPRVYKRKHKLFCMDCCRDYDLTTGEQIPSALWQRCGSCGAWVDLVTLHCINEWRSGERKLCYKCAPSQFALDEAAAPSTSTTEPRT
jgi:hypothetical protein